MSSSTRDIAYEANCEISREQNQKSLTYSSLGLSLSLPFLLPDFGVILLEPQERIAVDDASLQLHCKIRVINPCYFFIAVQRRGEVCADARLSCWAKGVD